MHPDAMAAEQTDARVAKLVAAMAREQATAHETAVFRDIDACSPAQRSCLFDSKMRAEEMVGLLAKVEALDCANRAELRRARDKFQDAFMLLNRVIINPGTFGGI